MAVTAPATLELTSRSAEGSRSARRLRRTGRVPGIIYGGGEEPQLFAADARVLRNTLAHSGAILEVSLEGGAATPVLVKDVQRHPVRGDAVHVDLLRVDMNQSIHTTVVLDLVGSEEAPGVVEGGVLSQDTRELNVEALPGDIPDAIHHDVSGMALNETLTVGAITAPPGVTLLDDPQMVVASITSATTDRADEDIETETEVIGNEAVDSAQARAQAEGDTAAEAGQRADES